MKYWARYLTGITIIVLIVFNFPTETFLAFMVGWLFFLPTVAIVYTAHGLQEYKKENKKEYNKEKENVVTKNISLDISCIDRLRPYIEKHKGNFSAAIRDVIGSATENSNHNCLSIDNSLFRWMVEEIEGIPIPDNILDEMIDSTLINSMENLENYLNNKFKIEWNVDIILKYDNNTRPSNILIEITGDSHKIKFVASLISQFRVKNFNLNFDKFNIKNNATSKMLSTNVSYDMLSDDTSFNIRSVINLGRCIKIELSRSNKKDAIHSLNRFFGYNGEIINAIKNNPAFWKTIIDSHILSNYNMVTIHRNYFEDLLANKVPIGETVIENMVMKPIYEIPLDEMLPLIKQVYETSRIVDRVEIDEDRLILFHNYRDILAIEKLKKSVTMLLETGGYLYDAKLTSNMIILELRHEIEIDNMIEVYSTGMMNQKLIEKYDYNM